MQKNTTTNHTGNKCTCERPDDNTCEYCEKQQEESILKKAKETAWPIMVVQKDNKNKQTAVEWLEGVYNTQGRILPTQFEQAKAMEKEQIIKSNRDGVDMVVNLQPFITGEEYYNETFGKPSP